MAEQTPEHEPVLVAETVRLLAPQPGQVVLDGTVGLGGHARAILPGIEPDGVYIGVDIDEEMLATTRHRLAHTGGATVRLVAANYADFPAVLEAEGIQQIDLALLDLGVNSAQLADRERGFSFERDGPLDMRFDRRQKTRALDLVNGLSETELADMFYEFGQEGMSRKIAKRICEVRRAARITTTRVLASAIESVVGGGGKHHPGTRTFQALRVAVNREFDNLERFLSEITAHMRPGGRLGVLAYHSIEDGFIKRFLREAKSAGTFRELTKRPVIADVQERARNRRSRSAKLRVAERLAEVR